MRSETLSWRASLSIDSAAILRIYNDSVRYFNCSQSSKLELRASVPQSVVAPICGAKKLGSAYGRHTVREPPGSGTLSSIAWNPAVLEKNYVCETEKQG
jgi:hypothetical protein